MPHLHRQKEAAAAAAAQAAAAAAAPGSRIPSALAAAAAKPLPSAPAPAPTTTSAAPPAPAPVTAEEWRSLPPRTQQALPLHTLNQHLAALAAHPPPTASGPGSGPGPGSGSSGWCSGSFCAPHVESVCGVSTTAAKLLLNTLAKLGRCEAALAQGAEGGGMQYRLKG